MPNTNTISADILAIQIKSAIEEIRNDRASGAAKQTVRAARLLVECAGHTPENLPEVASALADAQPTTGPIYNLAAIALRSPDVPTACHDFLDSMERNAARVAERAAAMVSDGDTVMTHSFSSTILTALREVSWGGKRLAVICPESRPICEGIAMAASLGMSGIPVRLIADAAIHHLLPEAQLVLVGADAASPRGIFNKTGTSLLALAARELGVRVYALCSSDKFLPRGYNPPKETLKDPGELLERDLPHVTVANYHFDVTPLDYFSGIATEEGILTPAELRKRFASRHTPAEPALAVPVECQDTARATVQ